jgi:L,D-transpeptidase ErfK/SrfK
MRIIYSTFIVWLLSAVNVYSSGAFPLEDRFQSLIGMNQGYSISNIDTLIELARRFDVGYNEIVSANSGIDPWVPEKGKEIVVPTSWLLPEIMDDGIVINLPEMRLYYFFMVNGRRYVKTYPIGIGRAGFNTPTGTFAITIKVRDPDWKVPESVRKERPELPPVVPPGPDNPLGRYWLQLSVNGYGIHGTSRPYGIGRKVSHGCIRLYPEDIEVLFGLVKTGTEVRIVDEPVKIGTYEKKVFIEVHRAARSDSELEMIALEKLSGKHLLQHIKKQALKEAINTATGLPTVISR